MTAAALLALAALQNDEAARKLFDALRDRIAAARTLRAELRVDVKNGGEPLGSARASFLLKGADRWRVEIDGGVVDAGPLSSLHLVCDGRKVHSLRSPSAARFREFPVPAEGARLFRDALRSSVFMMVFLGRAGAHIPPDGQVGKVKDGGPETLDGRKLRVVSALMTLSALAPRGEEIPVRLWIDPEGPRLVRREVVVFGTTIVEAFDDFAVDEEIPDAEFVFQSLKRLNRARAEQAAGAVDLFTRYTGRLPRSVAELAARPAGLDPDVFFPAGGFLLGAVPADPWGRPYEIVVAQGKPALAGRGADAKPGGKGDDEDALVPLRAPTGQAVGAPSERLRLHFESRVRLQLLAAAVRGYAAFYGALPRAKTELWAKAEDVELWPSGGWIPEGLPTDAWGDPLRMISEEEVVRVQIQDPKARRIGAKGLTPEERAGLEASARLRLSEAERAELEGLLDLLRADDFEAREKADLALRAKGPAAIAAIEARMKAEQDAEARGRLGVIRATLRIPAAPWPVELGMLSVAVGGRADEGEGGLRGATSSLKTLASAQADFRANDRDGNGVNDFWTADVAGLYALREGGEMIKLIELSVAAADAAPLEDGAWLEGVAERRPRSGYLFRAMTRDADGPYDAGGGRHPTKFAFCAYPEEYGADGTMTAIINEGFTIFVKDTNGEPVLEWPSDAELRAWLRPAR